MEIEKLKEMLYATREKNGVYLPAKQYEEECAERRQLAVRCALAGRGWGGSGQGAGQDAGH